MKILAYALFALVSSTVFAPTLANAQDVRVRIGEDRVVSRDYNRGYYGPRSEYRHDRRWRNRDRVVVVKQRRHRWE